MVKDLELDEFVAQVLAKDDELAKQVQESEVDAEAIIAKVKPSVDKYGVATGVAVAVRHLKGAVLEANSESVTGLLVGQSDRFRTNSPLSVSLLRSKGDHLQLTNWGTLVKYGDSRIEFPFPSIATVKIMSEGEYKGVPNLRIIALGSYEELSVPDTVARLNRVAKSVGEIDGGDELSVIVVKGVISFIAPVTKWRENGKNGTWQLYMPNARDEPQKHPVLQLTLEPENRNQVHVVFDRQRNAVPTIMVEDFAGLCEDAVAGSPDPVEQAKFLGGIVCGREVIIVGFMTKYHPQADINSIELRAYAMSDARESTQASLTPTANQ